MGVVYLGYDPTLERRVAIKFLRDRHRGGDRLREEGKALANLEHPNVVSVHEVAESRDGVYLVMAHIEGQTFDAWLAETPRAWRDVVRVLVDAGRGLEAVHRAGLAHRDVKPSNLLIDEAGQVRVADFGLAVRVEPGQRGVSLAGGTEAYMAPEQEEGGLVGPAADQYALCVCLLEALTGSREQGGGPDDWRRAASRRLSGGDAPPQSIFVTLVRGLQCDPEARYPAIGNLLDALQVAEEPRRSLWLGVGISVGLAGLAAGYVIAPDAGEVTEEPCAAQRGAFVRSHWAPATQGAVRDARPGRAKDPLWARSMGELDRLARAWDEVSIESCELHHAGRISGSALDDRTRCLQRQGREFDGLVSLLVGPDDVTAPAASRAIAMLERPHRCEVPPTLLGLGAEQPRVENSPEGNLERDLAQAWSRYHLGLPQNFAAATLEARAWELEDRGLRSDTARLLAEVGPDIKEKHRLSDLAVRSALEGRAPVMLAAALLDQGRIREWLGDLDGADERFGMAEAAIHAVAELTEEFPSLSDNSHRLRGQLELARGNLARRRGAHRKGLEHQRRAITEFGAAAARAPLSEAVAWTNIGEAHRILGEYGEANHAYSEAIALARPLLAATDDTLQVMFANRGGARQDAGDWAGAEDDYAVVYERNSPPVRGAQAMVAFNLALMDEMRGNAKAAAKLCRLALAGVTPDEGEPPSIAALFSLHCAAQEHDLGLRVLTVASFAGLYAELEARVLGDSSLLLVGQLRLARSMLYAQRWTEARRWIDAARQTTSDPGNSSPLDVASIDYLFGVWASAQGDDAAALSAHRRALAAFENQHLDRHPALVEPLLELGALERAPAAAVRALSRAHEIIEAHDMSESRRKRWLEIRRTRGLDE